MSQIVKKFIANNAVDASKISSSALGSGLSGGSGTTIAVDSTVVRTNGANPFTADQSMGSHKLTNVTDPVGAQDAATKNYVDNLANGLSWKNPVRAISTSNITLSGPQTIDGVSIIAGDRVLVAGQSTASQNGIYIAASGAWSRSLDADSGSELVAAATFVDEGTSNGATAWVQTAPAPITIGSTSLSFVKFSSTSTLSFNNGLALSGSTVNVVPGDSSLVATTGSLVVQEDAAGAIITGGSGIKIQLEASNPTLQISTNHLGVKLDAAGAIITGASGVKVQVDSSTIKINGSNQLQGLTPFQENLTLNGTDITNQYKDLSHAIFGSSASVNSIELSVAGGPIQLKGTDYTVSLTGGSGGVTRISFAGDLATGGAAALVSTDILMVNYSYLT